MKLKIISIILTVVIMTSLSEISEAGWVQLQGIYWGEIQKIAYDGNKVFCSNGSQIFFSSDNCSNWTQRSRNISFSYIEDILIKCSNENVTAVNFRLYQNYPNPFNPVSKIKFDAPAAGITVLKVFDILGREVSTLVNERLQPGTYEVTFDGGGLNSGVYFYRLTAGDYTETRKMILIK